MLSSFSFFCNYYLQELVIFSQSINSSMIIYIYIFLFPLKSSFFNFVGNVNDFPPSFIAVFLFNFFCSAFIFFNLILYSKSRSVSKFTANIIRIFHADIYIIFLIPNTQFFFLTITYFGENANFISYVYLIMGFFSIAYSLFHLFIFLIPLNKNPFPSYNISLDMETRKDIFFCSNFWVFRCSLWFCFYSRTFRSSSFSLHFVGICASAYLFLSTSLLLSFQSILFNVFFGAACFSYGIGCIFSTFYDFGITINDDLYNSIPCTLR